MSIGCPIVDTRHNLLKDPSGNPCLIKGSLILENHSPHPRKSSLQTAQNTLQNLFQYLLNASTMTPDSDGIVSVLAVNLIRQPRIPGVDNVSEIGGAKAFPWGSKWVGQFKDRGPFLEAL